MSEQIWYRIPGSDDAPSSGKVSFLQSICAAMLALFAGILIFVLFSFAGQGSLVLLFDWLAAIVWIGPLYWLHGKFVSSRLPRKGLNLFSNLSVAIAIIATVSTFVYVALFGTFVEGVGYGAHNGIMYGSLYATVIWTNLVRRRHRDGQANFSILLHWVGTLGLLAAWCLNIYGFSDGRSAEEEMQAARESALQSLPISISLDLGKCGNSTPLFVEWQGVEAVVNRTNFRLIDMSRLSFGIKGYTQDACRMHPRLWCDPENLPIRETNNSFYNYADVLGSGSNSFCAEVPPRTSEATDQMVASNPPDTLIWVARGTLQ